MIGAVRDAVAAVSECRRDAESCQRTVGSIAEELLDLRGEWSQMRTRVSGCERGLGELGIRVASATKGAGWDSAEPVQGNAAANVNGDNHRTGLPLEAAPTASPRTPPTSDPETLHPRRTNSPASGCDAAGFSGTLEEASLGLQNV